MNLNQSPVQSTARQPRGYLRVRAKGGRWADLGGWVHCEVEENAFAAADTFRIVLAKGKLPGNLDANWFSQQSGIEVEIYAGYPADGERFSLNELTLLIAGFADEIEDDMAGHTLTLHGRDKTALLIDATASQQFRSHTASWIARQFAADAGLDPKVTETSTKVGTYYDQHSDTVNMRGSKWDLLSALALREGFACYVRGNGLHFEPAPDNKDAPYMIRWVPPTAECAHPILNGKSLKFSRNLVLASGAKVIVSAVSMASKTPVRVSYPPASVSQAQDAKVYRIEAPANTSSADCAKLAQAKYMQITAHEVKLEYETSGDSVMSALYPIRVDGTGTAYDQLYYPDSITRVLSVQHGYTMRVSAKNRAPGNEV